MPNQIQMKQSDLGKSLDPSAHRVAIADFWRTSHHDGKISPGWWGGGGVERPPPFTPLTIKYKVEVYAPAERADTLNLLISTLYVLSTLGYVGGPLPMYSLSFRNVLDMFQDLSCFNDM
jgi:hypothetical protein